MCFLFSYPSRRLGIRSVHLPADIHSVENIQDEPAISLHLYTKPFGECDIYCIDKGTIERVPLVYDSMYTELC